ncbi:hypothetical protein [Paenibacillus sp.]|uniref:hypothetical protein n=1 Tax=Paenibacillus sp. TaxID=58172 RepID=UPI0035C85E79
MKAYVGHVARFFATFQEGNEAWDEQLLTWYNVDLQDRSFSHSYINQAISAITFYLRHVCETPPVSVAYARPKREQKLPNVLSLQEVLRLLDCVTISGAAVPHLCFRLASRRGRPVEASRS